MSGALLTGSRVYGAPTPKSDVDLVVLVTWEELEALKKLGERSRASYIGKNQASLRFGTLNLIAVTSTIDFHLWRRGTEALKARAPVTRAEAVEHFAGLRLRAGLPVERPASAKPWERGV